MAWQTTLTVAAGDVVTQTAVLNPVPAAPAAPTKVAAGIVPVFAGVLIAAGCLIAFRH